MVYNTKEIKNT